ncbi:uncharacterized protein LOC118271146 [Spodoptera frugiperda]|uniref:Uncharacterized protein LOC118271146 n=1 Tax=Spodoptera frugiperda TaxID=7108 RepID=A0A9R0D740_SPOFR|nr:uncharacterized protein LOC118271146 [Spodoptera frugiperda]
MATLIESSEQNNKIKMAQHNFQGDVGNINEHQIQFINKVIEEQDLNAKKVVFEPVGKAGDNFVANVKRINIEGDNGSLKMVVKMASQNEFLRQTTNTEISFNNEILMYTEVLPKLVALQKAAGIPEEEHLRYAKCYGALNEAPNEVIILEDLNESGFVMLDKFESLTDECVRSILKNFATLHSLSYVLKIKEPETYNQFKSKLINVWDILARNPLITKQFENGTIIILSVLDNEEHKNIIKSKLGKAFGLMLKLSEDALTDESSVIQQGDAWTNNIMFKFEEQKLKESIMIDYQASKNNSPVMDLLFMIFNCTDHETRLKHYYDWIDFYHSELDRSLNFFELTADSVYPRKKLNEDIKKYSEMLFAISIMLTNLFTRNTEEAAEMMETLNSGGFDEAIEVLANTEIPKDTAARAKKRIEGIVESFIEFGLL